MNRIYTIETEQLCATIATCGAELRSLQDKGSGREVMWSGDPSVWPGSAPILFPFVGSLKDGRTIINGEPYEMPMHGLIRTRDADRVEHHEDWVAFIFYSDEETLRCYPFEFELRVEFKLDSNGLCIQYTIQNPGEKPMLFSIGSHPGLAIDLDEASLEDYFIEFEKPETLDLYGMSEKYLVQKQADYLNGDYHLPLSKTLFDQGVLVFVDISSAVCRLKSKQSTTSVEVDLGGAPHLGLWAKPGAAYVCVEPWYSLDEPPDGDGIFENRPGVMRLSGGDVFETGYALRVLSDAT